MRLLVVDPHPIYRRGLAASLALMDRVENVTQAASPAAVRARGEVLRSTDLVVLDCSAEGGIDFIREVRQEEAKPVLICSADTREPTVVAALSEGASGFVGKDDLTHEALQAAITTIASGASVMGDGLLARVMSLSTEELGATQALTRLNQREQAVLALIADGLPTREIASELSYSERTVKNVLHDVVTKLGVRSRSQAVAQAVRAGLI